uniref:Cytochrome P450 family 26 subfamily A member 1 n=1 Tax=Pipistrellus kuhlii TaxID=59472 RepID=A0A7J7VAM0_PIPKU|nr:cytochrome P450 family 26 subfamily A member 1 [Pipistrellus kuhlii]
MKRRKYGFIYKTHLFGRPTVRVMGADNVRRILLGEHRLVSVHWPASVRTILGSGCLSNLHDSSHKQRKKPGGAAVLRAGDRRGGGRLPGAVAGLRRARPPGLPAGEAPHVPHRHADPAGLRGPPDRRRGRRAAARGGLRGNDPQPLLTAHRRALQRAVPGPEGAEPHPRAHRGEHPRQGPRAAGGRGRRRGLQRRAAAADRALVGAGREAGHAGTKAIFHRAPLWGTRNHRQRSHFSDHLPGALPSCSPESARGAEE